MRARFGTSGFSYREWCGSFYPERHPPADMLSFYASKLPTVELNNTFYRMPQEAALAKWHDAVPHDFAFAVKAPRSITHSRKLSGAEETLAFFVERLGALKSKLGMVLFQLPPFFKKDVGVLSEFLSLLPVNLASAFEFRNQSWFDDEVYSVLAQHSCALVAGDLPEAEVAPPLIKTAPHVYLRLRREDYADADLNAWAERLQGLDVEDVFGYFKHEQKGPLFAQQMCALFQ